MILQETVAVRLKMLVNGRETSAQDVVRCLSNTKNLTFVRNYPPPCERNAKAIFPIHSDYLIPIGCELASTIVRNQHPQRPLAHSSTPT